MTDVFLYSGESNPGDARLRDPSQSGLAQIVAALAVVEADDALSSAATLAIGAQAALNEAADALVSAGALAIADHAAIAEAADTVSSAATLAVASQAAVLEAADTVSGSATLAIASRMVIVEASDALSSAAVLPIAGQAAILEAPDTSSAAASLPIAGIEIPAGLSDRDDDDVLHAAATLAIVATGAVQEANDVLAATAAADGPAADPAPAPATLTGGAPYASRAPARRARRSAVVATYIPEFRPPPLPQIAARAFIVEADDELAAMAIIRPSARQVRARRVLQLLAMQ